MPAGRLVRVLGQIAEVGRALGLMALLCVVVSGCAMRAGGQDGPTVRERGEKEEAELLKRVKVNRDPQIVEYVTGVARRVAPDVGGARVIVIEDPTLAAFAMPGGRVYVHTGLISRVENEAQLATILARELAHDPARLPAHSFKGTMPRTALSPTAAVVLGRDLELAATASIEGYGPSAERDADELGLRRLVTAGYDPREAPKLFERLAGDGADRGPLEIFFYGTRPRMGERYEATRTLLGQALAPQAASSGGRGAEDFERRVLTVVRDNAALDIRAGRFALARRQLDRVLALTPNDPIAQLSYGDLHRLQSQRVPPAERSTHTQQAVERYRRAAELDPTYAEPLRQLGLLYYQEGDVAGARSAFQRYLALRPDAPDAQRVREYLAALPS
jgi:predicted Zn-dependent protease